jgi:Cysteine dioxygenase type I
MAANELGTRLLHPAARPRAEAIAVDALAEIAAGLARIHRTVPLDAAHSLDHPRSIRLLGTANYDVWLVTWPPGTGQRDHDHGESTAVFQVVLGSIVERRQTNPDRPTDSVHDLGPGMASTSEAWHRHELWNRSDVEATSVHVYSPPLLSTRHVPAEATSAPG